MAGLSLKHVYKVYEGGVKAVNDFSMDIEDREFIVFVGPSGCGKSTTLRMIAGLEDITAGELQIDGVTVNGLEPKDRNIAMVFQNYALYPHMSVYDNLAFSLKIAKLPNDEIYKKVTEAAEILGITEYLDRKPKALSGGQRQRVALGRAIVRHPKVFLLDEPLSNLDAKLRAAMRAEISRLHRKLATTFIYVTHDQVEAMTMGTRIVVMKGGFIQQIDTPQNLYKYPENMFVAGFIGTPQMNFFNGTVKKEGDRAVFNLDCGLGLSVPYRLLSKIHLKYMDGNYPIVLGIRPDDIKLAKDTGKSGNVIKSNVTAVEALGGETLIYANINLKDHENKDGALVLKADGDCSVNVGDLVDLEINLQKLHVFDRKTEMSINPRIPDVNILPCKIEKGQLIFADNVLPLPPALAKATDGEGEMILPTNAFSLGSGSCKAIIEEVEKVENRNIYRLKTNTSDLFAIQYNDGKVNSAGKEIFFDIDLSRIEIESCNVKPLDRQNQLFGTLVKQKAKTAEGKKNYAFYIQTQGQRLACPDFICKKLFDCRGTKIFGTQLEFLFPIQAVKTEKEHPSGGTALQGAVAEILDYGKTQYAKISVGSTFVTAPCKGNYIDRVFLNIDFSQVTVKDREHDIILV